MEKFFQFVIGLIVVSVTILLTSAALALIYGFVLMNLWRWFIVPTFGLPSLTLVQSMGMITLTRLILIKHNKSQDSESKSKASEIFMTIIALPAWMLAMGYIISLFL